MSIIPIETEVLKESGESGPSITPHSKSHWTRHIIPCLVLVQPRKTPPDITEKLLT